MIGEVRLMHMRAVVLLSVCSTYVVGRVLFAYSSRVDVIADIIYRLDIISQQGWRTSGSSRPRQSVLAIFYAQH